MTKFNAILFDLDGTLTDSGLGITKSAAYALDTLQIDYTGKNLSIFIGPPLRETFLKFGIQEKDVDQAISIYRSRYTTIGKFENMPYEGIEELLIKLNDLGYQLFVATSKPEGVAKEILAHFHLDQYFKEIAGASLDASRESKSAVISYLLEKYPSKNPIMIGDTVYDVIGSKNHHIPCIGVSWGYGNVQDMIDAGAISIVDTIDDLFHIFEI